MLKENLEGGQAQEAEPVREVGKWMPNILHVFHGPLHLFRRYESRSRRVEGGKGRGDRKGSEEAEARQ